MFVVHVEIHALNAIQKSNLLHRMAFGLVTNVKEILNQSAVFVEKVKHLDLHQLGLANLAILATK